MKRIAAALTTIAFSTIPAVALAHPGHGSTPGHSLLHYVAEPLHLGVLLGLVGVSVAAFVATRRRARPPE